MAVATWYEIHRSENGLLDIYKMDQEGNAVGELIGANRVDRISAFLLSEDTAKTVLVAAPSKSRPVSPSKAVPVDAGFTREKLAKIATIEAQKGYTWRGAGNAKVYTKKYEPVFGKGRIPWCAAFVTYCCDQVGLNLPVAAPTGYTFALCEGWQLWAQSKGVYHDNDGKFEATAGDIVLFDWSQKQIHEPDTDWEDHIGVVIGRNKSTGKLICAEGNVNDKAQIMERPPIVIQGFIRLPDGFKF